MKRTILAVALLGALATTGGLLAHEGHYHDAMGTVESIDAEHMTLVTSPEETLTFVLTTETTFARGNEATSREDVAAGERAVVKYEKEDGLNSAIEVRLAPKAD